MNMLIIRFSSLGDLVTLEPTFRAIRHFYKDAKITFLTSYIGKELYEDSDYFDKYIIHKNSLKTIKNLPKKKFDLVINLQCNKPSHYINLFINKSRTINKSFNLFQKLFKIKTHSKSAQELLIACGIEKEKANLYFKNYAIVKLPFKEDKKIKQEFVSKFGDKKVIAISTGSSKRWESKKWGRENYRNLILKLKDEYGIVLVGSELEIKDKLYIQEECADFIISYVNKTNLTELKTILHTADLYIGNDSGPSHIAAGVGTLTITIFGSTSIKHCVSFQNYQGTHKYIKPSKEIKCHPCYKSICPTEHECMKNITVSKVYSLVKEYKKQL